MSPHSDFWFWQRWRIGIDDRHQLKSTLQVSGFSPPSKEKICDAIESEHLVNLSGYIDKTQAETFPPHFLWSIGQGKLISQDGLSLPSPSSSKYSKAMFLYRRSRTDMLWKVYGKVDIKDQNVPGVRNFKRDIKETVNLNSMKYIMLELVISPLPHLTSTITAPPPH